MEERRLLSTTRQSSVEIARSNFNTVRKGGFDPQEVRSHLEMVAREVGHLENRIRELQEQLSDALRRAANPTFDEATLAAALGAQSAAILRSAHEEAGRVTAEAQERCAQLFTESQQRAATHLIEAQERAAAMLTEAEHTAAQIDQDARLGAERLIESAKVNGDAMVERGRDQGRAIVEQANVARRNILNDLAVKRKALHIQIEQLRAARDSMNSFVQGIREQVDTMLDHINSSDEAARAAALEALRLRPPINEPTEEELLAGTPLRHVPEAKLQPVGPSNAVSHLEPLAPVPVAPPPAAPPASGDAQSGDAQSFVDDDVAGTDVVNEIFARLRKATLEERGVSVPSAKKTPAVAKIETPLDELFARRDRAIDESLAILTRKVKRALQDDQNITLERLRDVRGPISNELEDELDQRRRYVEASVDALADATAAGVQFAFDESGVASGVDARASIDDCAADLAVTIVLALRKRILADGNGDAAERANAAYKEWRGARVERLCTDAARRAFHLGVTTASQGQSLRFFPAPNDAPCDACALDATAPARMAGQSFPSGSPYPPLHAGCACTVVPG